MCAKVPQRAAESLQRHTEVFVYKRNRNYQLVIVSYFSQWHHLFSEVQSYQLLSESQEQWESHCETGNKHGALQPESKFWGTMELSIPYLMILVILKSNRNIFLFYLCTLTFQATAKLFLYKYVLKCLQLMFKQNTHMFCFVYWPRGFGK